jgi:hypothetical protein
MHFSVGTRPPKLHAANLRNDNSLHRRCRHICVYPGGTGVVRDVVRVPQQGAGTRPFEGCAARGEGATSEGKETGCVLQNTGWCASDSAAGIVLR